VIETIRDFVIRRVGNTSLRHVARQVGMSPTGLSKFMGGTAPYQGTLGKLETWFLREQTVNASPDAETVAVALRVLARVVSPSRRSGFVENVLNDFRMTLGPEDPLLAYLDQHASSLRAE
jgi:hypothetical protein